MKAKPKSDKGNPESDIGKEIRDQYDDSIIVEHSPGTKTVHVWALTKYWQPQGFTFSPSQARKLGQELIRLADEIDQKQANFGRGKK